jgi:hypothetical protein
MLGKENRSVMSALLGYGNVVSLQATVSKINRIRRSICMLNQTSDLNSFADWSPNNGIQGSITTVNLHRYRI